MSADDLRAKLVDLFKQSTPTLEAYYVYAKQAAALAQEYHTARIKEAFPQAQSIEGAVVAKIDARSTPATLDKKLAELTAGNVTVKHVLFDPLGPTYYLIS